MPLFEISNQHAGICFGRYAGATEAEALDALARDAGYANYAAACEAAAPEPGAIVLVEVQEHSP